MKHRLKVKGEQVIFLQMDQQLKSKNINIIKFQKHAKYKLSF